MKKFIPFILVAIFSMIATSCMEDRTVVWEGIQVEFDKATGGSSGVYLRLNDGSTVTDFVRINLVAAQQNEPIAVNWELDAAATTAIENVHYRLVSSNPIVIPAGESWVDLQFEIIPDNLEAGERFELVFNLTGSDVEVAENEKTVTHSIEVSCPSDLGGTVTYTTTNIAAGPGGNAAACGGSVAGSVDITPLATPGQYILSDASFGVFGCAWGDSPVTTIVLNDACGTLSFSGSDQYGDSYSISNVSVAGNELTFDWSNTYGDGGTTTLTKASGNWPAGLSAE